MGGGAPHYVHGLCDLHLPSRPTPPESHRGLCTMERHALEDVPLWVLWAGLDSQ